MLRKLFFEWLFKDEIVYQLEITTMIKGEEAFDVTTVLYFDYVSASNHMHREVNDLIFERGARIVSKDSCGNMELELDSNKKIGYMIRKKKIYTL
jgi:hypothetical protein